MKKTMLFIFPLGILFFTSCKYDQKPFGVFTGKYEKVHLDFPQNDSLPVSSGTGTISITDAGVDKVDVKFSSPGNVDYYFNGLEVSHRYGLDGTVFQINGAGSTHGYYSLQGEMDAVNNSLFFERRDTLCFSFNGFKQ